MTTYSIGITLSASECRAAVLHQSRAEWAIDDLIQITHKDPNNIIHSLATMKCRFPKKSKIVFGMPHQQALIQTLSVDADLSDDEIFCYLQSRYSTPPNADAPYLDYETLSIEKNSRQIRVVSAHAHSINHYNQLFKKASLHLNAIDVDTLAQNRLDYLKIGTTLTQSQTDFSICIGLSLWGYQE